MGKGGRREMLREGEGRQADTQAGRQEEKVREKGEKGRERGGFRSRLLISISSSLVKISLDGGSCSKTTTMY